MLSQLLLHLVLFLREFYHHSLIFVVLIVEQVGFVVVQIQFVVHLVVLDVHRQQIHLPDLFLCFLQNEYNEQ
jgi:hypothetical protein